MKTVRLFIDESVQSCDFLKSSVDKYFTRLFRKNKTYKELIEEVNFFDTNEASEKYVISYRNKILSFYGNSRSLIYALFDFLQKIGWRFFTPKLECFLEDKNTLHFDKAFRYSYTPKFEYRFNLWSGASTEWQIINGMNAFWAKQIPQEMGSSLNYAGPIVHTFDKLVPPSEYFVAHPEYFALNKNGERIKNQLCLSNEEMFEVALKNAKGWLRENPTAQYISISQNDCYGDCQCENCQMIKKDGNPSDLMITFVNKFADALEREYPKLKVQTLAYTYTIEPPKYVKPRKNVNVMLCPIHSCENHTVMDENCGANKKFIGQLEGWKRLTDNLYLWKYYNDFAYLITPFQCLHRQNESFNCYANNGVKGFLAEGSHDGATSDFCELKTYLFAKLIYNPNISKKKYKDEIKDFCLYYYGENAGKYILRYLQLLENVTRNSHYDCYAAPYTIIPTNPRIEINDKYFIKKAKRLFETALKSVENKEKRNRIEKEYIAVLYYSLYTNFENDMLNASKQKRKAILAEQELLFNLIDKFKIKNVRQYVSGILVKKV